MENVRQKLLTSAVFSDRTRPPRDHTPRRGAHRHKQYESWCTPIIESQRSSYVIDEAPGTRGLAPRRFDMLSVQGHQLGVENFEFLIRAR